MRKFLVWVAWMVYHFVAAQDFNITQVIPLHLLPLNREKQGRLFLTLLPMAICRLPFCPFWLLVFPNKGLNRCRFFK
jgi:hypothetical protein